jgi:competence protein ComEC
MSQLLPCLAAAFALGIWLADAGWVGAQAGRYLAAAGVLGGATLRRRPRACAALLCVGCLGAGAFGLGSALERSRRVSVDEVFDARVEADVCGLRRHEAALRIELCGAVRVGATAGRVPERMRVYHRLSGNEPTWMRALRRGQRLRWELRVRPLVGRRNPGGFDAEAQLRREGIGAQAGLRGEQSAVVVLARSSHSLRLATVIAPVFAVLDRIRGRIVHRLESAGQPGALLSALCVGERQGLSIEVREAFTRSGLAHLLAVSGLHLSIVAGAAYWAARRVMARWAWIARRTDVRDAALVTALVVAGSYAAMCQFALPVRRAWIFLFVLWLGLRAGRRPAVAHLLSLAAVTILILDPSALFSAGAQLSFVVSAALLAARFDAEPAESGRVARSLWQLASSSAVAVSASAPVLVAHGMATGPTGLATNLIAIPWTAVALLPASLAVGAACAPDHALWCDWVMPLALPVAQVTLASVGWVDSVNVFGGLEPIPSTFSLLVAATGAVAVVCAGRLRVRLLLALVLCLGLRWAPSSEIVPPVPRMLVLDVGQGDALLVQGRRGSLLVDGGRALAGGVDMGSRVVLPSLAALGIRRLDLVIATHADLDHRGGLAAVLRATTVDELWLPRGAGRDVDFEALIAVARARGVVVGERGRGDPVRQIGDLQITPLWPGAPSEGGSRNDRSLVVRVDVAGYRLLLTGDLGVLAEQRLLSASAPELRADVLKVGHHGSAGSSSSAFLEAVGARVAVVSASCGSRMGLPSAEAFGRLEDGVGEIAWTGRDGAVLMGLGGAPSTAPQWRSWGRPRRCTVR